MKITLTITALLAISVFGSAYALESDNSYFLDDSEFISILIDVDSNGNVSFDEVFITPEGDVGAFIMDSSTVKSVRISSDDSYGRIFGQTTDGDYVLVIFEINGEDVKLKAKIWTENGPTRVISNGEVISLF